MSATAKTLIALILASLCLLAASLLYKAVDVLTHSTSTLTQQPASVDCAPRWSLNLVTDTNKVADQGSGLLNALGVVSQNDIWAVGQTRDEDSWSKPLTTHWDGVRWNTVFAPTDSETQNDLTGIAALSSNDVWAVGASGPIPTGNGSYVIVSVSLIEHWDGMQWSMAPSPRPGAGSWLQAVSAIGPNDIWAVGYYTREEDSWDRPMALHWNGTDWHLVAMPSLTSPSSSSARLDAIAAIQANDIWAVGTENLDADHFGGDSLIMRWDGQRWTEYPSLELGHLLAVKAVSAVDVWAIGYETNLRRHIDGYMKTLTMHWDGKRWSRVPSPDPVDNRCNCNMDPPRSTLHGIIVVNSKEIWALGSYSSVDLQPLALEWNGLAWSIASEPVTGYRYDELDAVNIFPFEPVLVPQSNPKCAPSSLTVLNPTPHMSKP